MQHFKYDINFIKYSTYAYILSILIIIIGIICYFTLGVKTSIDFSGGSMITAEIQSENFDIDNLRKHLESNFDKDIKIAQEGFENNIYTILLKMKFLEDEQKLNFELNAVYPASIQISQIESIGPVVGDELKKNARNAILFAVFLIGVYIAFRFDRFYSMGSVVAIFHDILVTLSIFSILNLEIDLSIIAAFLTIIGYSLNDTIVIFDRFRENEGKDLKLSITEIANLSLNQTLSRTIITSLTT